MNQVFLRSLNSSFFKCLVLALPAIFFLSACQTSLKPTRVYHEVVYDTRLIEEKTSKPLAVDESTVIVDARPPFERAMVKIPGSVHVEWRDFTEVRSQAPGKFKADLYREARRLAAKGVGPDSSVIVVGRGLRGEAEEGRLAWTLLYLGIRDVQVSDMDALGLGYSVNLEARPRASVPIWEPTELQETLLTSIQELEIIAKGRQQGRVHVVDVRTEREYLSQRTMGARTRLANDLEMINIPWSQFYTDSGRPNLEMTRQLRSIGIRPTDRILILSGRGVRGGAVAYALTALGYSNVGNLPGGYAEL